MTEHVPDNPAVELAGLTKRFGRQAAVDDLSLSIAPGSTLGFLGPNGAGKTTTIRMLMGLMHRDVGRMRVLGADPATDALSIKRRVGYVPEQQFIYRWARVGEIITFCRTFYPTWNDTRCNELLRVFALEPDKKVKHLSKGMVVKLALLLALAHEPELLILDEPMAGLDPLIREELLNSVLTSLTDRGQTLLFSSHTLDDVQRLADTVGIIHEGRLLVHRPLDELLTTTKRIRAVLANGTTLTHSPDGTIWQTMRDREWLVTVANFSPETLRQLQDRNAVTHFDIVDIGLEDIFKDYIRGRRVPA